jgi:hypothetical protein
MSEGSLSANDSRDEDLAGRRFGPDAAVRRPEYRVYMGMLDRCRNPNNKHYHRYGGRGIKVCDKWQKGFWFFYEDVGSRPSPGHSLDRYPNNDGNYEPGNVRWATPKEQQRNRRVNHVIEFRGERKTLAEWAEVTGLDKRSLRSRIVQLGWGIEQALTTPPDANARRYRGLGIARRSPKKPKYGPEVVALVRSRIAAGETQAAVSDSLGVSKTSIYEIIYRLGVYVS